MAIWQIWDLSNPFFIRQAKGLTIAQPIRLSVTYLRENGLNDEGLFRISPKQIKLDKVRLWTIVKGGRGTPKVSMDIFWKKKFVKKQYKIQWGASLPKISQKNLQYPFPLVLTTMFLWHKPAFILTIDKSVFSECELRG